MPVVVRARVGELDITLHDATKELGCLIEVHADNDFFRDFFRQVTLATAAWNGEELIQWIG